MNLETNLGNLKVRCPACAKLYEVQAADIHSENPLFQCISCDSRFSFDFPPMNPEMVPCFLIPTSPLGETAGLAPQNAARQHMDLEVGAMKACPKCAALNSRRAKECYSCHVIFERLEGLPTDSSLRAQPSLVRKWKNLLENFQNESLHEDFIESCHKLEALRFALMKYEDLRKAQGGDPLCDQMIARINTLTVAGLSKEKKVSTLAPRPKWHKYLFIGPFGVSAFLVLLGMMNLGHRNLVGVGVALGVMTAGLIIMIKGRLSLSDFMD